jgi:hypothetical protein
MFEKKKAININDYFKKTSERQEEEVYFTIVTKQGMDTEKFIKKYSLKAKSMGMYFSSEIENPSAKEISALKDILGDKFVFEIELFDDVFLKLSSDMDEIKQNDVSQAIYDTVNEMNLNVKNLNFIEDFYTKMLCWIYYRFDVVLRKNKNDETIKVMYVGDINEYELALMQIFSKLGCDIVIVPSDSDKKDKKIKSQSKGSELFDNKETEKILDNFSINTLDTEIEPKESGEDAIDEKINNSDSLATVITNSWLTEDVFDASLKDFKERAKGIRAYHNIFAKINGVEDIHNYSNNLLTWKMKIISNKKNFVIINNKIDDPDLKVLEKIHKNEYSNVHEMITGLSDQIALRINFRQSNLIKKVFVELMNEKIGTPLPELEKMGEYILYWLNKYIPLLFDSVNLKKCPNFIYFNGSINKYEWIFLRLLSKLPIDVFIITPDLKIKSEFEDQFIYIKDYDESLSLETFPENYENFKYGTVAHQAENQLLDILYKDTGLYKKQQFKKAIPVILETTYEEIYILWDKEARFRPNFESTDDKVIIPIICSKVLGVLNGNVGQYFLYIKKMLDEDSFLMIGFPYSKNKEKLKMKGISSFLNVRELDINAIKKHPNYKYNFIREPMQDYMLKCLQDLLYSRIIKGTFENEMEYTIINVILNLDIDFLRLIQKYDFTGRIPKLIIIDTTEDIGSVEDSIVIAYARQLGFDVVLFAPTGYRSVENHFSKKFFSYHNVGDYIYDLTIPDWIKVTKNNSDNIGDIAKYELATIDDASEDENDKEDSSFLKKFFAWWSN